MMIATAGHVDHGKTELVKLLTGCRTDKLPAEQERGLTIELGFAPCFIGDGLCVGIVDVPGHEKFVRNMVAGVSGIDAVLLVIAADDGIMPQTVEHFQIMDLMGVRDGIIALTKTDLVPPETVERRKAEIREFTEDTFLADAPVCPVSSRTFDGYPDFYSILVKRLSGLRKVERAGIFRMPVERSFTQPGFGTVVTGIPISGRIAVGDEVTTVPGNYGGRIRGLQCFLRDTTEGRSGQCLALNVPGFNKHPPTRGMMVCLPGFLKEASIFHVRVTTIPGLAHPLRNAEQIKFHSSTAEEHGKVYLLEDKSLGGAQSAFASVTVSHPLAAAPGDRFVLRRPSPAGTVAGGEILEVSHDAERPKRKAILERLRLRSSILKGASLANPVGARRHIEYCLRTADTRVASPAQLSRATLQEERTAAGALEKLVEDGRAVRLDGQHVAHASVYGPCLADIRNRIGRIAQEKKVSSVAVTDLMADPALPPPLWQHICRELEQSGLVRVDGTRLILQTPADDLNEAERDTMEQLLRLYDETGFHSPRPDELAARLAAPEATVARMLEYLCDQGRLVRVSRTVVLSRDHFRTAQSLVVQVISEEGKLDSGDFKCRIHSTRKYALAILDFLDVRQVTVRAENVRRLRPSYEKRLL